MLMWKPMLSSLHSSSLYWVNDTVQGLRLQFEHSGPCMKKNSYAKSDPFLCHGKVVVRYWTRWGENNWKLMQKPNYLQAKPVCFLFDLQPENLFALVLQTLMISSEPSAKLILKTNKTSWTKDQPNPTCWNERGETCFVWQLLHLPEVEAALRAS